MRKSSFIFAAMLAISVAAKGAAPEGYYQTCEGKSGASLLSALCQKISPHTNVGYDGLWNVYPTSDTYPDGTVWDMYSTKHWAVGKEHCGNYKYVGDCINREHSMPKSWFSEANPMKSDAFHVYPTDGKVNGQRSNYPYGECAGGTTLPSSGSVKALGRLGSSTFAGYSGTVFEPDDEYKGDFARTYFYMAACYNDRISSFSSDMMAGNAYPVYKDWAVSLLLKWHRQDPVSQKEIDRNEAVYAHQHNRNPFIDHPEMAEHIWGTNKSTGWSAQGTPEPAIATPIDGSAIDLGLCGNGVAKTLTVTLKAQHLTEAVTVAASGTGFTVTPLSIPAAEANAGAELTVTYTSQALGAATGTLRLMSGSARSSVTLRAEAIDGIPALPAAEIAETSFMARWVCIDTDGVPYTLDVTCGGASVQGYPRAVDAAAECRTVAGLTPGTTYAYRLTSPSGIMSNVVEVTTSVPVPDIQYLFDGDLYFTAAPGVPSEVAELLIDADNIDSPIIISVDEPFQLSSDKADWTTSLPLADEQERFYLRMYGAEAGSYSTTLTATAGTYVYDDITVSGVISSAPAFTETFEAPSSLTGYAGGYYEGSACGWNLTGALVGNDSRDRRSGSQGLRFNKTAGSEARLEMAEPREHGIGTVTLWARAWEGESGDIILETSVDGGITWQPAATFSAPDTDWKECRATVNLPGLVRMRLVRQSGRRICIDDIEATDYAVSALHELDYHSWDAFCRDGQLVIEASAPLTVTVCSPSGALWHSSTIPAGLTTLPDLPAGIYLVTSGGFTRKVVVR